MRIFILICSTYTFGSEQAAALYFNHFETVNVMANVMRIQYVSLYSATCVRDIIRSGKY